MSDRRAALLEREATAFLHQDLSMPYIHEKIHKAARPALEKTAVIGDWGLAERSADLGAYMCGGWSNWRCAALASELSAGAGR